MCGIAGYIGRCPPPDTCVEAALATMKQRGPDHQGFARFTINDFTTATLLSARLAIVDLEARSNMPFRRGSWAIIFNGEIYNHEALRLYLEKRGEEFLTSSDTEVLLAGLILDGVSFLDRAEGMWSFAAVDEKSGDVYLSRDRFGEKPLFFHTTEHGIYFASEIKTLKALSEKDFNVNIRHVLRYLINGYRSLHKVDETWFEDVYEFPARQVWKIDRFGKTSRQTYWEICKKEVSVTEGEVLTVLKELIPGAIRLRLRADVPIACCLSGGIDSSTIASVSAKVLGTSLTGFSILDSNPDYDERAAIEMVAKDLNCDLYGIEVPNMGFLERLEDLIRYHDGPLSTSSYYVHSFLSEAMSKNGFRVALSGTGADELFTGYYDHYLLHIATISSDAVREEAVAQWREHVLPNLRNPMLRDWNRFISEPNFRDHLYLRNDFIQKSSPFLFDEPFQETDFGVNLLKNRMLNELFFEVVPPILREDDLNSMRWSVENRSPFLDRKLADFCATIPAELMISNGYQKSLLRKAMDGILVDSVRLNRKKIGFNASITTLLKRDDIQVRKFLLENNPIFEFIQPRALSKLLEQPSLSNQESQALFSLVNATIFLKLYF